MESGSFVKVNVRQSSGGAVASIYRERQEVTRRRKTDWTVRPLRQGRREQPAVWFAYLSTSEFLNWMYPSRTAVYGSMAASLIASYSPMRNDKSFKRR